VITILFNVNFQNLEDTMNEISFPFHASPEVLRRHIVQHGSFDETENTRLYEEWYTSKRPRDIVLHRLNHRFKFSAGTILDAGCGYGSNIALGQTGSYGIELDEKRASFTKSIGLPCYSRDLVSADLSDLPKVDTVFLLSTLEHLDQEHTVLRKLVERLRPGGLMVLSVPCRPISRNLERIPFFNYFFDDHGDHVNGYSPESIAYRCERAGLRTRAALRYSVPLARRFTMLPFLLMHLLPLALIGNACIYVGSKVEGWEYPKKSTRRRADNAKGYVSTGGYLE
jgi:SAM-dependent methyltransferase